jgi:hypothetical protein
MSMKRTLAAVLGVCLAGASVSFSACSKTPQTQETRAANASADKSRDPRTAANLPVTRPFKDMRELPGTIFEVTYTPNTVRIDAARWQTSLQSVSADGKVWVFDPGDDKVRQLSEGKIMFLEDLAVMKVLGAVDFEGRRIIVAARAGLPDLIQKGRISWRAPIRFADWSADSRRSEETYAWNRIGWFPTLHAAGGGGETASGEDDGWKYSIHTQPGTRRLDLSFRVSKDISGLGASIEGKGHVNEFVSAASMTVDGGSMNDMTFANSNLSGEFDFNWAATAGGDNSGIGESKIKLPTMYTAPLPIGGIPFVLSVGEQIIVKPGLGAKREVAKGSFKVTFGGGEGISIKNGGAPEPQEHLEADSHLGDSTTGSLAPIAMLIAVCVPKVTLGLGTESGFELLNKYVPSGYADRVAQQLEKTLLSTAAKDFVTKKLKDKFKTEASAYVQVLTVFTLASAGSLSLLPCKLQRITVLGQAGADATILGQSVGDKKMDLFKKALVLRQPDVNACGEK